MKTGTNPLLAGVSGQNRQLLRSMRKSLERALIRLSSDFTYLSKNTCWERILIPPKACIQEAFGEIEQPQLPNLEL